MRASTTAAAADTVGLSTSTKLRIGTNVIWQPVSGLDIGAEVIYARLDPRGRVTFAGRPVVQLGQRLGRPPARAARLLIRSHRMQAKTPVKTPGFSFACSAVPDGPGHLPSPDLKETSSSALGRLLRLRVAELVGFRLGLGAAAHRTGYSTVVEVETLGSVLFSIVVLLPRSPSSFLMVVVVSCAKAAVLKAVAARMKASFFMANTPWFKFLTTNVTTAAPVPGILPLRVGQVGICAKRRRRRGGGMRYFISVRTADAMFIIASMPSRVEITGRRGWSRRVLFSRGTRRRSEGVRNKLIVLSSMEDNRENPGRIASPEKREVRLHTLRGATSAVHDRFNLAGRP